MDRRNFICTGAKAAGALALSGCAVAEHLDGYEPMKRGDMYEFRKGTHPFEIYFLEGSPEPRELAHIYAEKYEGEFREDLVRELDYASKRDSEYIKKWMDQTNEFLAYLSNGDFQLDLRDVVEFLDGGMTPKYEELTSLNRRLFRMLVSSDFKKNPRYQDSCGAYKWNGLFYVDPFEFQINREDRSENTYSTVALHEIITHGFCRNYESLSRKSVMNATNRVSVVGLTRNQSDFIGWPHVKPIRTHPMFYLIDKKKGKFYVGRV
jgi:hypothetical protein